MSRIEHALRARHGTGRGGFIPFVTAGDPDVGSSVAIIRRLAGIGADVIELGVPFSDPMADGPVIQRSSQRALMNGMSLALTFDLAAQVRESSSVPLVLFSYFNPIARFGVEAFARRCRETGIDGVLITDVVDEEALEIRGTLESCGVDLIQLVSPTTSDRRMQEICRRASGFVYAISRNGVTGARGEASTTAEALVERVRRFTDLPVAVGFGISNREQIRDVWRYADAAVVGSAIVAEIEGMSDSEDIADGVAAFVGDLLA